MTTNNAKLKYILLASAAGLLAACGQNTDAPSTETSAPEVAEAAEEAVETVTEEVSEAAAPASMTLAEAVAARSDEDKARDQYRNPAATLAFFGVEPDDTVVEILPGGGWYTKVILPYVAKDGALIGVGYNPPMFYEIFDEVSDERMERFRTFPDVFAGLTNEWTGLDANVTAYNFGSVSDEAAGSADAVLFVRALHNLNRVGGDYLAEAMADVNKLLKPGGVVGVVQHRATEDTPDEAATGARGYLKQSDVIAIMEGAGFVLEEASEINANAADRPTVDEFVWRLPPTLGGDFDEAKKAEYAAIGESDRMTLRFRKPAE